MRSIRFNIKFLVLFWVGGILLLMPNGSFLLLTIDFSFLFVFLLIFPTSIINFIITTIKNINDYHKKKNEEEKSSGKLFFSEVIYNSIKKVLSKIQHTYTKKEKDTHIHSLSIIFSCVCR